MRVWRGIGLAVASLVCGATGVACFDLLHSTADIETACEIDAARSDCVPASQSAAIETNFCNWSPAQAQEHALRACAWLGACESPVGNNAFGPCYFRALMAYDCIANPNHRVRGEAHQLWDCLQRVRTCGDVDACIFEGTSPPMCGGGVGVYTACDKSSAAAAVRVRCVDGSRAMPTRGGGENCALWGQACAEAADGTGTCAGDSSDAGCKDQCNGSLLHWCEPAGDRGQVTDLGVDCASFGTTCGGFPTADAAAWAACIAETDASAAAADCAPDASATCEDGSAVSCPSGVRETIDCATLLGSRSACNAGALEPPFDWTSSCSLPEGGCATDSCDGMRVTSCERGASFSVDCTSAGLGPCQLIPADPGGPPRAACTPLSP
jgi:hypothetical protein